MADDLEAFLRQAAQRRAQRQKQTRPQRPPTEQPAQSRQPPPVEPRRVPPAKDPKVADAQVVPQQEPSRLGTRVTTSEFEQRAERLGEEVGLADEMLQAHLHEKFDHQLGQLDLGDGAPATGPETSRPEVASGAEELADLLRNARSLRHAIVLSEILTPPHHRW